MDAAVLTPPHAAAPVYLLDVARLCPRAAGASPALDGTRAGPLPSHLWNGFGRWARRHSSMHIDAGQRLPPGDSFARWTSPRGLAGTEPVEVAICFLCHNRHARRPLQPSAERPAGLIRVTPTAPLRLLIFLSRNILFCPPAASPVYEEKVRIEGLVDSSESAILYRPRRKKCGIVFSDLNLYCQPRVRRRASGLRADRVTAASRIICI